MKIEALRNCRLYAVSMLQEFDYDVTIMAFNIRVTMKSADFVFTKGYG